MSEPKNRRDTVAIVGIIAVVTLILACIAACTVVSYVFLANPPW